MPDKLAPEPCSGARFLARIKASVCQADCQRAPGEADVRILSHLGDVLPSCLVTPFTAPAPTSSGRPAVPASWHRCQVGAKNVAQVPFSLARDNSNVAVDNLAEDRRSWAWSVTGGVG